MSMEPSPEACQRAEAKRKKIVQWYGSIAVVIACAVLLYWALVWRLQVYTNDAYVEGNQVAITPLRPGFVTAIHTDDTFLVKKGQLLIELDETDAIIALNRSREHLAQTIRNVCQMFHQVFAYQAEIEIRKAELIRATQDYEHRVNVLDAGGVSLEDFEHAVAALRSEFFSLMKTEILYEQALSLVQGTSIVDHPLVLEASDQVRDAWVQLYRCNIYSPVEGLTSQRKIQVGMWIDKGQPLMSVIPLDQIWVNANYKETQLKKMRIGQRVKITSDLYGDDVLYHGKIVGLPAAAGNAFSLLPPQNLSGNWIKIVQRLPVRVALDPDELKRYPLRLGLSMESTVDLRDQQGELVPTTTRGSPTYDTPIYLEEEKGDQEWIQEIIEANIDPTLEAYFNTPLLAPRIESHDT